VQATLPLVIDGKYIPAGFTVNFKEGSIEKFDENTLNIMGDGIAPLISTILSTGNMDKLGEVALVAGSRIGESGRVYNSTLLDENAAPHVALGNGYEHPIEGIEDITDPEKPEFLKALGVNSSANHVDFMIGGPNVQVFFEKAKAKEPICLIDNDKFLLDETA
jgi:aminopeptidase